jgi:DNA-binding transcriptional LysR family regulator
MDLLHYAANLACFTEVVRFGSFSAAARHRGLAPSSVVRQIDLLEQAVGQALFVRSTRALQLTDAGRILRARADDILDRLRDTRAELDALLSGPAGRLRISCLPTFGKLHILPLLPALRTDYPALEVELDLTERLAEPSVERLDGVIRIGRQQDSTLHASLIGRERWHLCAAPECAGGDWRERARIDKRETSPGHGWRRFPALQTEIGAMPVALRCDDFDAQRQAALAGLGIACLPDWVIGADLATGRLLSLQQEASNRPIVLLRPLQQAPARLRVLIERLQRRLAGAPVDIGYLGD